MLKALKKEGQPIIFSALSGWLLTLSIFTIKSTISFVNVPDYTDSIPIWLFALLFIAISSALYAINRFWLKDSLFLIMPLSFLLYGLVSVGLSANNASDRAFSAFAFSVISLVILVLCINYAKKRKIKLPTKDISTRAAIIFVISAFLLLSTYWILLLWARLESYCAPGFDMGIFMQMCDNMVDPEKGFLPVTTCERGFELTHFAVHFSPILYSLAPFCLIFEPGPVLVFAQILLVISGVFPIFLICKQVKLSNAKSVIMSLLYMLYPVMSSGGFYDFHENAFLAPLILWTLYFAHKKKWYNTILLFLFAILVLMVKEDAAIYVAFISLYIIFGRKDYLTGALMFAITVGYFFLAINMISYFQQDMLFGAEGNMLGSRYANIIGEEGGFMSLVKVLILNPALYVVKSLKASGGVPSANKLVYALNMLLPIAFLPLITRKPSRWLLLGPFYVLNLVTDYQYQYDIGFQYSFGSGALLVYLAVVNFADLSSDPLFPLPENTEEPTSTVPEITDKSVCVEYNSADCDNDDIIRAEPLKPQPEVIISPSNTVSKIKGKFISWLAIIGIIFALFSTLFIQASRAPYQFNYAIRFFTEKEERAEIAEVLADIPRDKTIMATSMYITHLYDADEIYSQLQALKPIYNYRGEVSRYEIVYYSDYAILDLREYVSGDSKLAAHLTLLYKTAGYEIVDEREGLIRVLKRGENSPPVGYTQEYIDSFNESEADNEAEE